MALPAATASPIHGPDFASPRLWLDTDLALGTPSGDVDDGFALAAVLSAPGVELLGISAVAGNTDAASAERAIHALLAAAGVEKRGFPVVGPAEAPKHLAELPEGARIVALGPLGNVMGAVALDPALPSRVAVSVVATVLRPLLHPLWGCFCLNTRADRCSARAFFAMPWPGRRIFPLDVVERLRFGARELERMACLGPLGRYLAESSRRWLGQAWWRYRASTFPAWDLVAALDAVGALPGARFSADGERLLTFDPEAARERFFTLLGPGAAAGLEADLR